MKVLVGYPEERIEQGILDRVLGGFEADLPPSYGIGRVTDAAGLAAAARRRAPGAGGAEPGRLHHGHRAGHAERAGAHAGRVAPGQRGAAQDGAGGGPARRAGVRRARRREGARAGGAAPPGRRWRPSSSSRASPPTRRCAGSSRRSRRPGDRGAVAPLAHGRGGAGARWHRWRSSWPGARARCFRRSTCCGSRPSCSTPRSRPAPRTLDVSRARRRPPSRVGRAAVVRYRWRHRARRRLNS